MARPTIKGIKIHNMNGSISVSADWFGKYPINKKHLCDCPLCNLVNNMFQAQTIQKNPYEKYK